MTPGNAPWRAKPKTKIVCTIGSASQSEQQLQALLQAGANVIRLNFSHGAQEAHAQVKVARFQCFAGTKLFDNYGSEGC